ncbi:uncharacterized protein LOC142210710 isoform X2 [Leptodactylus fuscus]|uniref:uncharacterized protein LOC142210710 isoform X2 n=1 Tax=Leptodactylus fuscus TaxID=238119 RepID=UPI003F4EDCA0
MTVCAMFGCTNRMHKGCGKHFFRFPMKDPERLSKWIEAVQRNDWTPSIHSKVCSDHFTEKDYMIRPGAACPYLRMDAVPTPLYPIQRRKKTKKRKYTKKTTSKTANPNEIKDEKMEQEVPGKSDVSYTHEEEMGMQSEMQMEERPGKEEGTGKVEDHTKGNNQTEEMQGVESDDESQLEQPAVKPQLESQTLGPQHENQAMGSQRENQAMGSQLESQALGPQHENQFVEQQLESQAVGPQHENQFVEQQLESQVVKPQLESQAVKPQFESQILQSEEKTMEAQGQKNEEITQGKMQVVGDEEGTQELEAQNKKNEKETQGSGKHAIDNQDEKLKPKTQSEQQVVANRESQIPGNQQRVEEQVMEDGPVATKQSAHKQSVEAPGRKQGEGALIESRLPDMRIVVHHTSWHEPARPPCENQADYITVDHAYSAVSGDKENDIPTPVADPKVVKLRRKIKSLQKQVLRQGAKIKNLKKTLVDLRKNNMMERDPEQVIAEHCSGLAQVLFTQQLKNGYRRHSVTQYCSPMKEFALSLYYASPKAYKFCRLFLCLPHPVSLRNWKAANEGNLEPSAEESAQRGPGMSVGEGQLHDASMQDVVVHKPSSQEGHLPEAPMEEGPMSVIPVQEGHLSVIPMMEGHFSVVPMQDGHFDSSSVQE